MTTKFLNLDTDSTFTANSDYLIPSQKAIKTALDLKQNKISAGEGITVSDDGVVSNSLVESSVTASNYVSATIWKGTLADYNALGTYSDTTTYIITDDSEIEKKATSIYQTSKTIESSAIVLEDLISVYTASSFTAPFTIDLSSLSTLSSTDIITFELYLTTGTTYPGDGVTGDLFDSTVTNTWMGDSAPTFAANTKYLLAFRSFDQGTSWIGNLQCEWTTTLSS